MNPATTYELRKIDWGAVGALMGALSAIGAFVAAWAAYKVGKSSADISAQIAREAQQARFRRAFAAKLAIEVELELAKLRLLQVQQILSEPGNEMQQFQSAVNYCRTVRTPELERYSGEMDLFDFSLSIHLTTARNLYRQLGEIYGDGNKVLHQESIPHFSQRVGNLVGEIQSAQKLIHDSLGWGQAVTK